MDYLDTISGTSTLHIKCDKRLHIGMKVEAMKAGKSMNQFIVDLLEAALRPKVIRNARMATPAERIAGGDTVELPPTPVKKKKFPPSIASML